MTKPNKKYVTIKGWAGIIVNEYNQRGYAFIEQAMETLEYPAELRLKVKYIKKEKKDE